MTTSPAYTLLLTLAAIVPTVVIVAWLNRRGRPWSAVLAALAVGAVAAAPALLMEKLLMYTPWKIYNLGVLFLFAFVVAGLVEESCKLVAFYVGFGRSRWFVEEYDGILFAACTSLGFATVENWFYTMEGGFEVAKWRAFTAVPAHAAFGILMGSCLGMARVRQRFKWSDNGLIWGGLMLATMCHGFYDLLAFQPMSHLAAWLLVAFLVWLVYASVGRVRRARARSAAFGGVLEPLPPPLWHGPLALPPLPQPRNPWLSGLLGFVPGLGQAYNRDMSKALLFFAIGVVNLGLWYAAWLFVEAPQKALKLLLWLGLAIPMEPDRVAAAIEQKWMLLPTLLTMVSVWAVVGALDAYVVARGRWLSSRPQWAVRRSFSTHGFGTSYVLHLIIIFMLVFAPVLGYGGGGGDKNGKDTKGGQQGQKSQQGDKNGGGQKDAASRGGAGSHEHWDLTWVEAPSTIDGWTHHTMGQKDGKGEAHLGDKPLPTSGSKASGMVHLRPPGEKAAQPAKGTPSTYDEYLSYQIRRDRSDWYYFRNVPTDVWTVVRYRIAADGSLLDAQLVETSGTPDQAQRAVGVVMRAAPYLPLPGHVRSIEVTELFWTLGTSNFPPGSVAERLSTLPDGRSIRVEE